MSEHVHLTTRAPFRSTAAYRRDALAAAVALQNRGVFPGGQQVRTEMGGGDLERIRAALKGLKASGQLKVTVKLAPKPRAPYVTPPVVGPSPPDIEERIARHGARVAAEEAAWLARQGAADERLAAECRAAVLRFESRGRPSRARSE